jgi:hypothetical protein
MATPSNIVSPNGSATTTAGLDASTWAPNMQVWGNSYIVWGTEGIMGNYIVLSASESQRIEEINISQGAGFTAIVVLLMDGIDVDIEVIDDRFIAPPTLAENPFMIVSPFGSIPMLMVNNTVNQAPKREGHRSFKFKSFVAISSLQ